MTPHPADPPPNAMGAADTAPADPSAADAPAADQPAAGARLGRMRRPDVRSTMSGPFGFGLFATLGALLAVLIGIAVRDSADVLVLVAVAALLAVGLDPLIRLLGRYGVRRSWAVLIVVLTVLGALSAIVAELISVVTDQIAVLRREGPQLIANLLKHRSVHAFDRRVHVLSTLRRTLADPDLPSELTSRLFRFGSGALTVITNTVVIIVLTVYFLAALPQIKRAAYSLAPSSRRARVGGLIDQILWRTGRFVVGTLAVALLAGTVTAVFLAVVGLGRFALPLALLVALLDLVPLAGSIVGAAVVVLTCFASSASDGITALIVYLIYEPIEGYVIYPRVMRSSIEVPEYVSVMAVLLGAALGGIVGALLSLPLVAALLYLVREVWVPRQDAH